MSSVRHSSAEPAPDRPEKRPRLDDPEPAMHISIEPSAPVPVDSDAVDIDSGPADYARNPSPDSRLPARPAHGQAPENLSKRARAKAKRRKNRHLLPEPYTGEWIVAHEVDKLLGEDIIDQAVAESSEWDSRSRTRILVCLTSLSRVSHLLVCLPFVNTRLWTQVQFSFSDSLSIAPAPHKPWVIVTPHALPGEKIRVRVYRHSRMVSYADLLEVIEPNPEWRDMSRVRCKYFGKCSGCQYQMLSYEKQLELKREVVIRAFETFSAHKPEVGHSNPPDWLKIGFNVVGTRKVMDIEECSLATETINAAYKPIREQVIDNIYQYKKGVSLCLRDSLERTPLPSGSPIPSRSPSPRLALRCPARRKAHLHHGPQRHGARARRRQLFEFNASAFFQNNNSILVPLTSYVNSSIFDRIAPVPSSSSAPASPPRRVPTHLLTLLRQRPLRDHARAALLQGRGIELAPESIEAATQNAALNRLRPAQCTFLKGDAADIFRTVADFRASAPRSSSTPRARDRRAFIEQMLAFGCETVVYVSCNVHTQARDIGMILRKSGQKGVGPDKRKYVLESLRGFDLFPQTAHVESVAVLRLV
ncbi:uncharacterized protein B0H18DRAFT_1122060 [Fomitopsis serialis]|uniref:uncharacterized protein n=1 Tax=Fomitopsis serialis TaxID=139415 RepID=UPI002007E99D|nr:uncharacterized protein B0H18DRAFT_1122060 [Neoantrodia serialis]KAH9920336.1 hypothetical protein B0H18DRAFT_1122060 [Neoantrodia serialis]